MTLAEQITVLLEAIDCGFPGPGDIVLWGESVIAATNNPPLWLIDLSLREYLADAAEVAAVLPWKFRAAT